MTMAQAKALAHELTIEFLRANPAYLKNVLDKIPEMVDDVADINERFYNSIIQNKKFDGLY